MDFVNYHYRNIYWNDFRLQRGPESQLYFVMASLTRVKICIEKKKRATALIYGGKTNKRPARDTFNKRCKLSDLANYIPNANNLQERVASSTYSKSKRKFEISEETIIRSIAAYDGVMVSKSVRLCRGCFIDKNQQKKA